MTTWTWPLQPGPAPIPIVGMRRRAVIAAASCSGHELEDDREGAGLLDGQRIGQQRSGLLTGLALDPDLADRVDRLGRQADVAHHRDPGLDDRLDRARRADATFDLDGLGTTLLEESPGILQCLVGVGIGEERHVGDDERVLRPPRHGPDVVEHVGHGHPDLVLVAEDRPADRIADEQDRHAGFVEQLRRGVVVGRKHRDPLALGPHPGDVDDGQATDVLGRGAHLELPGAGLDGSSVETLVALSAVGDGSSRASRAGATRSSSRSATSRLPSIGHGSGSASGR